MRSLRLRILIWSALLGVLVAVPAFDSHAVAAGASARVARKSRIAARSLCARPLRFSPQQLIPAMLSLPLIPGPHDSLTIDGVRVPIGDCGPATIDPNTGEAIDNRPTTSGSAWIARMKRRSGKSARTP